MTAYKWKPGSRIRGDAQKVGEVCERLERKGNLTPKALVDASRRKNAPLHDMFEWDDAIAAEAYRETQAGYIIRSIEVTVVGNTEPVRAFVNVSMEGGERSYIGVQAALSVEETRDEILEAALAELRAFERKYSTLVELAEVFAAIKKVA